jgi:hypothetical protein
LKEPSESDANQKTRFYSSDAPSPHKPELHIVYTDYDTTLLAINENNVPRNEYFDDVESYVSDYRDASAFSLFYLSQNVKSISSYLQGSTLFFVHTHGNQTGFKIAPSTYITMSDLTSTDLGNLDFALLLTCNTGDGGYSSTRVANNNPINIVEQLIVCGATTAVGFDDVTYVSDCNSFAVSFSYRTMALGLTVNNAIRNMDCSSYYSDMSQTAVIGGNSGLYLD